MESDDQNVSWNGEFTELEGRAKIAQKIRVCNQIIGLQYTNRPDSFVVDMEHFSHLTQNDMNTNSRITLQRNMSRKGSARGNEKKINHNETCESSIASPSPRAGASTLEMPVIVTMGAADYPAPQALNQLNIVADREIGSSPAERKTGDKRFGFRRLPPPSWNLLHPRRILLFFATLSSMGTMLLIYFTLSIGIKLGGDETALN